MMHCCICLCVLTLIAALYLLAKVQKEALGMFFKWMSYFLVTISTVCLICCLWCMTRCHGNAEHGSCSAEKERCGAKKECCKEKEGHCKKDSGMQEEHSETMMSSDSAASTK